jgi:hypothetical protein
VGQRATYPEEPNVVGVGVWLSSGGTRFLSVFLEAFFCGSR